MRRAEQTAYYFVFIVYNYFYYYISKKFLKMFVFCFTKPFLYGIILS